MPDADFHASSSRGESPLPSATFGRSAVDGFAVILDKQGDLVENMTLTNGAAGLLARVRELGDGLHA